MSKFYRDRTSPDYRSNRKILQIIPALMASFMVFLDSTIVNLTLPTLHRELGGGHVDVEWTLNSYTLTFASIMLVAGALSDKVGARRVFLAGLVVFGLASGACGLAGNMSVLTTARLAQGIGAALLLPSSLKLALTNAKDVTQRAHTVSLWSATGGLGMSAGPLLGGLILTLVGWRWVFLVNTVVAFAAIILTLVGSRPIPPIARRVDIAGLFTATAVIGGVVFALVEGPQLGWASPSLIFADICFIAGLIAFIMVERKVVDPILPFRSVKHADFIGAAVLGLLLNFSFYGLLFALSFLLQDVRGDSALVAGLYFLPLTGLLVIANLTAPRLAHRLGSNAVLFLGQALFGASMFASIFLGVLHQQWALAVALIPGGFGAGILVPTITSRLLESAPTELAGAASGVFQALRQVGSAIGVAVFGAILGNGIGLSGGFQRCLVLATLAVVASSVIIATLLRPRRRINAWPI